MLAMMALFIVGVISVAEQPGWNWVIKIGGGVLTIGFLMGVGRTGLRVPREAIVYGFWTVWTLAALPMVIFAPGFFAKLQTLVLILILIIVMTGMTNRRSVLTMAMISVLIGAFLLAMMAFQEGGFRRPSGSSYGEYANISETESYTRLTWRGMNPNGFGRIMIMGSMALGYLWLLYPRKRLVRWVILGPMLMIMIAACIFSGSRFAILGMGVASLSFFFWGYRPEIKRNPALIVYALVALSLLFAFALFVGKGSIGFERMKRSILYAKGVRGKESRGSGASRGELYSEVMDVAMRYPITGIGLIQFPNYSRTGHVAHSEFGEIIASTGFPGAVIYFSVWILLWQRSGRLFKSKRDPTDARIGGVFRAILVILAFSGLGAPLYSAKWVWTMLGTFIGYSMTVEETDRLLLHQRAWWAFHHQQMLAAQAAWRKSQPEAMVPQ